EKPGYILPSALPWLAEIRVADLEMHNPADKSVGLSLNHIYPRRQRHAVIHGPRQFYSVQSVAWMQIDSPNQSGLFARQLNALIAWFVQDHSNLKIKSHWLKDLNSVAVSKHRTGILNSIKLS